MERALSIPSWPASNRPVYSTKTRMPPRRGRSPAKFSTTGTPSPPSSPIPICRPPTTMPRQHSGMRSSQGGSASEREPRKGRALMRPSSASLKPAGGERSMRGVSSQKPSGMPGEANRQRPSRHLPNPGKVNGYISVRKVTEPSRRITSKTAILFVEHQNSYIILAYDPTLSTRIGSIVISGKNCCLVNCPNTVRRAPDRRLHAAQRHLQTDDVLACAGLRRAGPGHDLRILSASDIGADASITAMICAITLPTASGRWPYLCADRQGPSVHGEADGVKDGDGPSSGCLEHRPDVGVEAGAPFGAEAIGDLAEDDAGAQRLFRAVVGRWKLPVGDEDKQVLAIFLDDPEQLAPLLTGGLDPEQPVELCFELGQMGPKGGIGEPVTAAAC